MRNSGILFIALSCFILIGCKKTANVVNNDFTLDSIKETANYHLFNDTTKPYCDLQIKFVYPATCTDSSKLQALQTIFITKFFDNSFAGKTPKEAVETYKKQYIENYKLLETEEDNNPSAYTIDSHIDESQSSFSYYEILENRIFFNQDGLLSFSTFSENFTGGAHGTHLCYGYTIDLNTGNLLAETDIFCENYSSAIANAIVYKIMQANNLSDPKELENIGYTDIKDIAPNGNFLINDKGITYIFNEYDIAPYVMGQTEVFLPYNEINLYINKEGPLAKLAF
ncbi:MAG: RsiV family protein [Dysgonamonadaceae bacterium]|jgi:hypothetical protein|nr:RsiV family protein [Dysgonamonadaceae bacterium]